MVELGAEINKENEPGETPLFETCSNSYKAIVKYLVNHGANVNKTNIINNETSLFSTCSNGNKTIMKYLVELGAEINE